MKFRKISKVVCRAILLTSLLGICSLPKGTGTSNEAFADEVSQSTPPSTVNIKVHKLMYDKSINVGEKDQIENDGYVKTQYPEGVSAYDKNTYGDVEFTIYDITSQVLPEKNSVLTDDIVNTIVNEVENKGTNSDYIKKASSLKKGLVNNAGEVSFDNMPAYRNAKRSAYLIYETKTPKGMMYKKAQPMVFVAPLTTIDSKAFLKDINIYPKNITQKLNFELTKLGDDGTAEVNAKALAGASFSLYKGDKGKGEKIGDITADKNGLLVGENLTMGSYYFVENPSAVVAAPNDDPVPEGVYLLGADARNDANNKLGFEITADGVEPDSLKGSYINYLPPEAKKEVTNGVGSPDKSFQVGQLVHYKGTVHIPNDVRGGKNGIDVSGEKTDTQYYSVLKWHDIGGKGLTYVSEKADIKVTANSKALTKDTDYKVTDSENGFTVDFIVKDGKVSDEVAKLAGTDVVIDYNMIVNQDAVMADELENSFTLSYNNNPYNESDVKHITGKVPVFTYGAKFIKEDSGLMGSGLAKSPLPGAIFVVKDANGKFYAGSEDTDSDGVEEVLWETAESSAKEIVSDKDGLFQITGLTAGEYTLVEIKAPDGYQKMLEPIKFTVNKTSFEEENRIPVLNDQKGLLPRTGSQKTALVMIVAGVLGIAALGGLFYKKNKMKVV